MQNTFSKILDFANAIFVSCHLQRLRNLSKVKFGAARLNDAILKYLYIIIYFY